MMPKLLYESLDEIGTDFAVIDPTAGLGLPRIKDDETRRAVIRGYNIVPADYFRDFSDRMTPAAIIPMHTPEERFFAGVAVIKEHIVNFTVLKFAAKYFIAIEALFLVRREGNLVSGTVNSGFLIFSGTGLISRWSLHLHQALEI
jgi:hypothetical protein